MTDSRQDPPNLVLESNIMNANGSVPLSPQQEPVPIYPTKVESTPQEAESSSLPLSLENVTLIELENNTSPISERPPSSRSSQSQPTSPPSPGHQVHNTLPTPPTWPRPRPNRPPSNGTAPNSAVPAFPRVPMPFTPPSPKPSVPPPIFQPFPPSILPPSREGILTFWVCNIEYGSTDRPEYKAFSPSVDATIADLEKLIVEGWNMPGNLQSLWLSNESSSPKWRYICADEEAKLTDVGIEEGIIVVLTRMMVMRKPIIYLFPPTLSNGQDSGDGLEVEVNVKLAEGWKFSYVYPAPVLPTQKKELAVGDDEDGRQVLWRVRAHEDGELELPEQDLSVSYLFWEASHGRPQVLPTPPSSGRNSPLPQVSPLDADPLIIRSITHRLPSLEVTADNSVLMDSSQAAVYLHHVLKYLGLHVEARTSFITYWLPSIQSHSRIALRFLPQPEYEQYAAMNILPHPDVVRRIFMVFTGVPRNKEWSPTQEIRFPQPDIEGRRNALEDAEMWWDIIGFGDSESEIEKWKDPARFRVLEWGGLEV